MEKPKILIIGVNWLGDVIMTLPAIKSACDFGDVTIITRPHLVSVYSLTGLPINCIPIATNENLIKVFLETKLLRKEKADYAIAFPNSLRAAIVAKMCGAKTSIGFNTEMRSWLLTKAIKRPDDYEKMHESRLYAMLTASIGCKEPSYSLSAPAFSDLIFNSSVKKAGIDPSKKYIVLAPGAAFGAAKRWPPHKFAEVATNFANNFPEIQIAVTAAKNEKPIVDEIASLAPSAKIINVAGKTTIWELAAILSRASVLIANDSGTMHLAALYSTPTVVPVGPTDMARTGALNPNFIPIISESCPQIPCRQRVCPLKNHLCMESISSQLVFETAAKFLYTKKD